MKKVIRVLFIVVFFLCFSGCIESETKESAGFLLEYSRDSIQRGETVSNHGLTVHYLDVGQADAALLICNNQTMLIDGGNADDSSLIAAYLKKQKINYLDYVVCSHADKDHVGGLSGALSVVKVGRVYAPQTESLTKAYRNFKRKVQQQGKTIEHLKHGDSFSFGESRVEVLAPVRENYGDRNNTSIVLKIHYGTTSFLFTGDAEREAEYDMLNLGCDLSSTVLKVSHHGSSDSTSYWFLREVMPKFAVISVGKNSYGHPSDTVLSRLRDGDVTVYRTDIHGHIIAESDGETVSFIPSKNPEADSLEKVR
ncbi:MAG: MBL fold metallo-hydrolase [Ruminococcaceae bacterium]|nr:MBL fold metallo-hydrolase [Oscillospiraceae bacterium]